MNPFLKDTLRYSGYTILGVLGYICVGFIFRYLHLYNPVIGLAFMATIFALFVGVGIALFKKYIL